MVRAAARGDAAYRWGFAKMRGRCGRVGPRPWMSPGWEKSYPRERPARRRTRTEGRPARAARNAQRGSARNGWWRVSEIHIVSLVFSRSIDMACWPNFPAAFHVERREVAGWRGLPVGRGGRSAFHVERRGRWRLGKDPGVPRGTPKHPPVTPGQSG